MAAEALAEANALATARSRVTVTLDAATTFAQRFPRSPRTSRALAEVGLARHLVEPTLHALVVAHLDAVEPSDRRRAVHAALAVGEVAAAARAVARWERADADSVEVALLAAEVGYYDGRRAAARAQIARLCKEPPRQLALRCYELVHESGDEVPGVVSLRNAAMRTIKELEAPGERAAFGTERMWAMEPELGNSLARALDHAHAMCAPLATKREYVFVEMYIPLHGEIQVHAATDSGALHRCLEARLRAASLERTRAEHFSTTLELGAARAPRTKPLLAPPAPLVGQQPFGRGVVIGFVIRSGGEMVSTSVGAGVRGKLALVQRGAVHLVGAWDLEGSFDDGGDGMHVARGYAGVGVLPTERSAVSLVAGAGSTSFGSLVSQSYEVPVEAAARVSLSASVKGHVTARASTLIGASGRNAAGIADELGLGFGLSVRANAQAWITVDAMLEKRVDGTSGVLSFGIPLGSYY